MASLSTVEHYPYFVNYSRLPDMFAAINSAVIPSKFTYRFLEELGFSSSNDRGFIPILKFLNILDDKGIPTIHYIHLRSEADFPVVLGRLIKTAYKSLFSSESNLVNLNDTELFNVFNKATGYAVTEVHDTVSTFKTLTGLAIFTEDTSENVSKTEAELKSPVSINLSIKLPTTTDPKVYDVLFKYLKDLL